MTEVKLTPKQEKFCQVYIEGGNASEAYRQSYDCARMKETTINRNAKAQLDNSKIAARVRELATAHLERHEITVDSLVKELEEARVLARSEKAAAPMVSATMGKGKLLGLIVEKNEHTGKDGAPIEVRRVERVVIDPA